MASLSTDKRGNRSIQFTSPADRKRKSVRLGKVPLKAAEPLRGRVEALVYALAAKSPPNRETGAWVASLPDATHAKFAAVGLVDPRAERKSTPLGRFLGEHLARREVECKGATLTNYRTVANSLTASFGADAPGDGVSRERAEAFRAHMTTGLGLRPATVQRRLKTVKAFFRDAVDRELIAASPFAKVRGPASNPAERQHFVSLGDAERVIAVCDPTWRLIVALARYAGLRCPSEVLSLKWEDVDMAAGRMAVFAPKQEHVPGRDWRVVPVTPLLRPYLEEAFEAAGDSGAVYVVPGNYRAAALTPKGWVNCNLRTRMLKLIRRAGLAPWPRPFHNLRSSLQTEWAAEHPQHVVCAWLGNTEAVAVRHYLQVRDEDYARAAGGSAAEGAAAALRNPVRTAADQSGRGRTDSPQSLDVGCLSPKRGGVGQSRGVVVVGAEGFEPPTSSL